MFRPNVIVLLLSSGFLHGCAGFESAKLAVNPRGPEQVYPSDAFARNKLLKDEGEATNPNTTGLFVDAYIKSVGSPNDSGLAFDMASKGYDLVDDLCNQFFYDGGNNQKWLNFSKDIVAAVGTLGTGIAALATSGGGSATAAIALGTATAYNGVDVYTRNFLFGAENIGSVQSLVVNALKAHRDATIGATGASAATWTFGSAVLQVEAHQFICQSAKIRDLVLQAIKGGTVTAYTAAGTITTAGGAPIASPVAPPAPVDPTTHVNIKAGS